MSESGRELIASIVRAENEFPRSFADVSTRTWGTLFHTPSIPESHDGNHACITSHGGRPKEAIREVIAFYGSRSLQPRVNLVSAEGDDPQLRAALEEAGFTFAYENAMRIYVHRRPSRIAPSPEVLVRRITDLDQGLFHAIAELNDPRVAKVLERRMRQQDTHLLLGELDGQVVSLALLERAESLWRVDEVHTHPDFRGRGCARAVIHELVTFHCDRADAPLYLWTDDPVAERIYSEAGFEKLDAAVTSWIAWLGA